MEILNKIADETLREEINNELQNVIKAKESEISKVVNDQFNKLSDSVYEKNLKNILGERLPNETKLGDYITRATTQKINEIKQEYDNKLSEIKNKPLDETIKNQINTLETKVSEYAKVLENKQVEFENVKTEYNQKLITHLRTLCLPKLTEDEDRKYKAIVLKQEFDKEINNSYELEINENNELIAKNKNTYATKLYKDLASDFLKDVLFETEVKKDFNPAKPTQQTGAKLVIPDNISLIEKDKLITSYIKETTGINNAANPKFIEMYQNLINQK